MKGKYITIEGIEGIGKSFFIEKLKNKDNFVIKDTDLFGFGLEIFNALKNKDLFYRHGNPIAEALCFSAVDLHEIETKVIPNLKKGKTVIQDRGADTCCLYAAAQLCNGNKTKLIEEYKKLMELRKKIGMIADKTLIFTGNFEKALKRAQERDGRKYTEEEIKMLKLIDYGFKQLIKIDKRFVEINVDNGKVLENIKKLI